MLACCTASRWVSIYAAESRRFAPETTMMEFSPLSALEMCATPQGPATICTAWVSTPAAFRPESSLSVKRSVPRDPIMSTVRTQFGDGHRLVGALASVEHIEAAAENRLARGGEAVGARHQVDVDAADYQ